MGQYQNAYWYRKMLKIKKFVIIFIHEITKINFNQFSKFLMTVDQKFFKTENVLLMYFYVNLFYTIKIQIHL